MRVGRLQPFLHLLQQVFDFGLDPPCEVLDDLRTRADRAVNRTSTGQRCRKRYRKRFDSPGGGTHGHKSHRTARLNASEFGALPWS